MRCRPARTGASSSSGKAWRELREALRAPGRRPGRAARPGARRDPARSPRGWASAAVFANEDYEPAAIGPATTPSSARSPPTASPPAPRQGPGGLREGRGAHAGGRAVRRCSRPTSTPGSPRSTTSTSRPIRWRSTPAAREPAHRAPAADARGDWASSPPTCARCRCRPACPARGALFADFRGAHGGLPGARATSRRRRACPTCPCTTAFGTISIRELARAAWKATGEGPATWLSELVWRDFYFQILWHHPHAATGAFRREYDAIAWPGTDEHFAAWCEARTGYPDRRRGDAPDRRRPATCTTACA